MQILENLEDFPKSDQPIILTIGNFDGMHRGHISVLQKVKSLASNQGKTVVITFRNHPSEILRSQNPIPLLSSLPHKLRLIESFGIQQVLLLNFTSYLAQHSAASFIENIRQFIPFTHLVLGHDATLGRDRQGDRQTMENLGIEWGFHVHYIPEFRYEGKVISSTRIREELKVGNLDEVELLLDRPYSIYGPVIHGKGKGKELGTPTANIDVTGLCLPPLGVYAIEAIKDNQPYSGIANLGIAPTFEENSKPVLEVHLFDKNINLYGNFLEIIFKKFIRPEKKFNSVQELKEQIALDVEFVNQLTLEKNSLL